MILEALGNNLLIINEYAVLRDIGTNFTVSNRYSLTPDYRLKIADVESVDSSSYWCRVYRRITGIRSQDLVDLDVKGKAEDEANNSSSSNVGRRVIVVNVIILLFGLFFYVYFVRKYRRHYHRGIANKTALKERWMVDIFAHGYCFSTFGRPKTNMCLWLICLTYSLVTHVVLGCDDIQKVCIERGSRSVSIPCVGLVPDEGINLLYWYKGESLQESMEHLLVRYADRDIGTNFTVSDRYSLTADYGLKIADVELVDGGRYWCRVIRQVTGRESKDFVDLVVTVVPQKPIISHCDSSMSSPCQVEASASLVVNCTVSNAFPTPDLTWSFIGCEENRNITKRWFVSNQRALRDPESKTYNVTVAIYLGEFGPEVDDVCSFECVATGVAILEDQSSSILNVSGKADKVNKNIYVIMTVIVAVIVFLVIVILVGVRVYVVRKPPKSTYQHLINTKGEDRETAFSSGEVQKAPPSADTKKGKDILGSKNHVWRYVRDIFIPAHQGSEVTGVVALSNGGIAVATKRTLYSFSPEFEQYAFTDITLLKKEDSPPGSITSIAKHARYDSAVVCLESGLRFMRANVGISVDDKVSHAQLQNPIIATDENGAMFGGEGHNPTVAIDENSAMPEADKDVATLEAIDENATISVDENQTLSSASEENAAMLVTKSHNPSNAIDENTTVSKSDSHNQILYRIENSTLSNELMIEVDPVNIAAYGRGIIFVNNGKDELHKYSIEHVTDGEDKLNIKRDTEKFQITVPEGATLGRMAICKGALYIVSCCTANGHHNILQYNIDSDKLVQAYKTDINDLVGLCFVGKSQVALYGGEWVKIYHKKD